MDLLYLACCSIQILRISSLSDCSFSFFPSEGLNSIYKTFKDTQSSLLIGSLRKPDQKVESRMSRISYPKNLDKRFHLREAAYQKRSVDCHVFANPRLLDDDFSLFIFFITVIAKANFVFVRQLSIPLFLFCSPFLFFLRFFL